MAPREQNCDIPPFFVGLQVEAQRGASRTGQNPPGPWHYSSALLTSCYDPVFSAEGDCWERNNNVIMNKMQMEVYPNYPQEADEDYG
jgi:hypothetical protein